MLTVETLRAALEGLDRDAQVVVGIMEGPQYDAAYAEQMVCKKAVPLGPNNRELRDETPHLYICCFEEPRPWEFGDEPQPRCNNDGSATLEYDPEKEL